MWKEPRLRLRSPTGPLGIAFALLAVAQALSCSSQSDDQAQGDSAGPPEQGTALEPGAALPDTAPGGGAPAQGPGALVAALEGRGYTTQTGEMRAFFVENCAALPSCFRAYLEPGRSVSSAPSELLTERVLHIVP